MSNETLALEVKERNELAASRPLDMQPLFEKAINSPGGADALAKLQEIYFKSQDRNASLEFAQALAKFQDECPPVPRTTLVSFASSGGKAVKYKSADFEQIIETTRPHLRANGFSISFDTDVASGMVTATCTLRHVNGHSITAKATIPSASSNPGMSEQQKVGSANTFAKRTALTSVLGLSLTDPEEEGGDPTTINAKQVEVIRNLLKETGTEIAAFMNWATGDPQGKVEDIRLTRYDWAVNELKRKKAAK